MLNPGIASSSASTPITTRDAERSERRCPTRERLGGVVHHFFFLLLLLLLLLLTRRQITTTTVTTR